MCLLSRGQTQMKTKITITRNDLKTHEFNGAKRRKVNNSSNTDESSNALVSKLIYNLMLKGNKNV